MAVRRIAWVIPALLLWLLFPAGLTPAPVLAQVESSIIYVAATNTIEVKRPGAVVTLSDIDDALRDENLLERAGQREWRLKANLKIFELVRLELHGDDAGGDVNRLKLNSGPSGFVSIESSNGQISIRSTRITSWDEAADTFDTDFLDGSGRAYISAKNRTSVYTDNRMDVIDSEIAYLGFFEETAYGISWKVISEEGGPNPGILGKGMTGTVTGSKFHHNYFGLYVWGVGDMEVRNNEFYDNYGYGFDAHTVTQRVTVENNFSHDNGLHGIIFADRCTENVVRGNRSVNNEGHGIMLHELSDDNTIEDNEVTGNSDGVALFESSNNAVTGNIIRDNVTGIRIYGRAAASADNIIRDNEIRGNSSYGVFMYDAATGNSFSNNLIVANGDSGVYLKAADDNIFVDNEINDNEYGIRLDSAEERNRSTGNQFRDNTIQDNRNYGVYSYPPEGRNRFEGNLYSGNALGDITYLTRNPLLGGGRLGIIRLVLLGAIIAVALTTAVMFLLRWRRQPPPTHGAGG
ncbi:MAG: right-handed parallel beta-helix repeat-containing protein [Dehalococcoidales bacterium]|nr:right-handed parallel beta-helix repeat-containing protein [Dehalococcoidales bacterium]